MIKLKEMNLYFTKYYKIVGFVFAFLIIFADLLLYTGIKLWGDSHGYFLMSEVFENQGIFNFQPEIQKGTVDEMLFSLRGYAYPYIIALCKLLGGGFPMGYELFYALFLASGLGYALPELCEMIFCKKVNWFLRVIPTLLTMFFWNGLIIYPLTDIPAVVTVSFGLLFLMKVSMNNSKRDYVYILLSGIFLGVSYYIRSGCKPIIFISIATIVLYKYKKSYLQKTIILFLFSVGILISMIPQVSINKHCNDKFSYEVPIFFTVVGNAEYYYGFKDLRWETNISGRHPEAAMISYGSTFDNILSVENIAPEDVDMLTVISLFGKYPFEMIGLYATKFANMIDPRYGEVYIDDLNPHRCFTIVFNFFIWFITFLSLGLQINEAKRINSIKYFFEHCFLYVLSFLCPGLVHLAGTHVEPRYFYPCYVFAYAYLSMQCDWKVIAMYVKKQFFNIAIIGIALFSCLNAIWNFTFENFHYSQLLLEARPVVKEANVDFNKENNLVLDCAVTEFEFTDDFCLKMRGYAIAKDRESKDSKLILLLVSDDMQYEYEIKLRSNYIYETEAYMKSKFTICKQLIELEEGKYKIGLKIENNEDTGVVWTEHTVNINKQ